MTDPLTCIHCENQLCPECLAELEEDEGAWMEFGHHPDGIRRTQELQAEMEAARDELEEESTTPVGDDIPF